MRGRFIVDGEGRKLAVVIPLRDYHRLLQDLHDLATLAGRRQEATASLADVKSRLKAVGLLQD